LALSLHADLILIDDRKAALAAIRKGLGVIGTLGILDLAARRGLIDLATAFTRLKATSFRYRQEMLDELLRQLPRKPQP
jgi:predicted nucleic acid-binding protein